MEITPWHNALLNVEQWKTVVPDEVLALVPERYGEPELRAVQSVLANHPAAISAIVDLLAEAEKYSDRVAYELLADGDDDIPLSLYVRIPLNREQFYAADEQLSSWWRSRDERAKIIVFPMILPGQKW